MRTPLWAASVTAAMARLSLAWREPAGFSGSAGAFWARLEPSHRQGGLDGPRETRDLERLGDVVVGAEGERALQDILVRGAADHDDLGMRGERHDRRQRADPAERSEEHTSELQSLAYLVCRLLLEKKKKFK